MVARIVEESHTALGEDLPRVIDEAVALVGMTAQMSLVNLAQRALWPVPKDPARAISVEGSLAGSAFQFVRIFVGGGTDGEGVALWLPMLSHLVAAKLAYGTR